MMKRRAFLKSMIAASMIAVGTKLGMMDRYEAFDANAIKLRNERQDFVSDDYLTMMHEREQQMMDDCLKDLYFYKGIPIKGLKKLS
jgi:hypothetical protein